MLSPLWIRVQTGKPCPICNNITWCAVSVDGFAAVCARVRSGRPTGVGWWHRVIDQTPPDADRPDENGGASWEN